jgi:multiple sugar transport system substrate-binding protein
MGGGGGTADEEGPLSVTGVWTEGEAEAFEAVLEHVQNQTDEEIQYEPRDTESILTGTLVDYESGVATADIVVMPSPARIRSDAEAGHLASLGDTWDAETFAPDPDQVSVDGEVYAAPFKMDLKPGFWYRESFFDEHGLSEPQTEDEFRTLLGEIDGIDGVDAPLASGNGNGWPLSDQVEAFLLHQDSGAELQRELIAGESSFTDDRVRRAFGEVQQLLQQGYFSELRDFGVQYEYFWDEQLPLYFMGSWTPGFDAISDPSDLGVFMLPETDAMVASVNWFTVPRYTENQEAARRAVQELVSAESQRIWAERGGFIASNLDVSEDAYQVDVMQGLSELADEVTLVPDLDDALGDPFQSEFWSQLTGFWSNPDTEIDTMLDRLDEVLQETLAEEEGED